MTSFSQKLTFLIDIQIAIFDKLHERLQSNLEAYLSMTTSLGRAMGGVTKEEHLRDAVAALDLVLTDEEAARLEAPYRPRMPELY